MYGAIIGDIAGSQLEGYNNVERDFDIFDKRNIFTDDTLLTVAIGEAFMFFLRDYCPELYESRDSSNRIKAGEIDESKIVFLKEIIVRNMIFWGRKYPNAGFGRNFRKWLRYSPKPYNSYGNGSAMRVSPVGWMFEDIETTRKMAAVQAEVSHNHPEGIRGAEAVVSAVFLARNGSTKDEIRRYIADEFGYDMDRTCEEIRPEYTFDVSCQGSVPESIIAFLDGNDFEDVIRNAVSLGGDTDTIGAIAGSIAEAYYGVPEEMKMKADKLVPEMLLKSVNLFEYVWQG